MTQETIAALPPAALPLTGAELVMLWQVNKTVETTLSNLFPFTNPLPITRGGTGATTASAALAALGGVGAASPTFTGTVTMPDLSTWGSGGINGAVIGATTPEAGTFTTLTAVSLVLSALNGTPVGPTTPSTGSFTALAASGAVSGAGFTALFASPPAIGGTAPAAGSFTTLSASGAVSGAGVTSLFASPPALGSTAPAAVAATTLAASGAVSGTGFSNYLASPPAIGGTAAAAGSFTNLSASGTLGVTGVATFTGLDVHTIGATLSSHAAPSTNGTIWNDSTQNTLGSFEGGLVTYKPGVIWVATASVTTAGTAAVSWLSGTAIGTLTLPANFLVPGKSIRIKAYGLITTAAAQGTANIVLSLGGTTIASTGAQTFVASGSAGFEFEALLTCRASGSSGSVIGNGSVIGLNNIGSFGLANGAPATINTTTTNIIGLTSTNSVGGGTVFGIFNATIEVLG